MPLMIKSLLPAGRPLVAALALLCASSANAANIMPHRALYTMSLVRTGGDTGVSAARGAMEY